jgi:hypothetical protein
MLKEYRIKTTTVRTYPILADSKEEAEKLAAQIERNRGFADSIEAKTISEKPTIFDELQDYGFIVSANERGYINDKLYIKAVKADHGYIIRVDPATHNNTYTAAILDGYHLNVQSPSGRQSARKLENTDDVVRKILSITATGGDE